MTGETLFLAMVCAAFGAFIVVLGVVSTVTRLGDRRRA